MSLHRKDSEGAKTTKRSRRKKGPKGPIYVASVKDYSDKRGARGGVYDLSRPQNDQLIFTVWGSDLKEMRQRKHWLVEVLKKEQSPQPGAEDNDEWKALQRAVDALKAVEALNPKSAPSA